MDGPRDRVLLEAAAKIDGAEPLTPALLHASDKSHAVGALPSTRRSFPSFKTFNVDADTGASRNASWAIGLRK
jgi:hypothetical protein